MDTADEIDSPRGGGPTTTTNAVTDTRGSVWLRALLREVEHSGSGSTLFWGLFWSFFPNLTEQEIWRAVHAAGARGDAQWTAIRDALDLRHRSQRPQ